MIRPVDVKLPVHVFPLGHSPLTDGLQNWYSPDWHDVWHIDCWMSGLVLLQQTSPVGHCALSLQVNTHPQLPWFEEGTQLSAEFPPQQYCASATEQNAEAHGIPRSLGPASSPPPELEPELLPLLEPELLPLELPLLEPLELDVLLPPELELELEPLLLPLLLPEPEPLPLELPLLEPDPPPLPELPPPLPELLESVQQPPAHCTVGGGHSNPHREFEQTLVPTPWESLGHVMSQVPQCVGSWVVSMQKPLQSVWPAGHTPPSAAMTGPESKYWLLVPHPAVPSEHSSSKSAPTRLAHAAPPAAKAEMTRKTRAGRRMGTPQV